MTTDTLDRQTLNRATLLRQALLEKADTPIHEMVEHLVGMQAQNPLDPYYALWARLEDFHPGQLGAAIANHEMVRGQFMRGTIHLFTADDALAVHPVMRPVLERVWRSTQFAKDVASIDTDAVLERSRSLLEERPLTRAELGRVLVGTWPDCPPGSLAQTATYLLPVVQVPPRGVWGEKGQARWSTLQRHLGRPYGQGRPVEEMVLRYLAAFGPAAVKDMRVWSGLTGLREVFDRVRPRLRTFRDENGGELYDLPDIELPDPDTPAPPRLLPEYDNALLGHDDRSRFFVDVHLPKGWVGNVLVDGYFAGGWRHDRSALEVSLTPRGLRDEEGVRAEATRLAALAWPDEPTEIVVRRHE